jgi:hypothetical protein
MSRDTDDVKARINGGTATTGTGRNPQTNASALLRIGASRSGGNTFNGTIAFCAFGTLGSSQALQLHTLYKQTLGTGLGLP